MKGAIVIAAAVVAVALGARILEKHFTYSRTAQGPDHAASLETDAMKTYCQNAAVGVGQRLTLECKSLKQVLPIEQDVRRVSRQSIVATRCLTAGTTLQRTDLTIKRPGTGIPPFELANVVGRKLGRAVEADMPLQLQDLG